MFSKVVIIFLLIIIGLLTLFFNFGKFLNASSEPVVSDMVVCLGGGSANRIKKSVDLYEEGYVSGKTILITGDERSKSEKEKHKDESRLCYVQQKELNCHIAYAPETKHTKDEILYIKHFMIDKGMKSTIIVSDPPHLRRIKVLLALLHVPGDDALSFTLIGATLKEWDDSTYYAQTSSRIYAVKEGTFLLYSLLSYGVLRPFGLNVPFENFIRHSKYEPQKSFLSFLSKYL